MIGVRRSSRVVRKDIMRCVVIASAAIAAATAGPGHFGILGAAKSKSPQKLEDPFLTDDNDFAADDVATDDEIPEIPANQLAPQTKSPPVSKPAASVRSAAPPEKSSSLPDDLGLDLTMPDEPVMEKAPAKTKPAREPGALRAPEPEPNALEPELKTPRRTRDIRSTAIPKLEEPVDFLAELGGDAKTATRPRLPTLKNTPIGDKPGWKSLDVKQASAETKDSKDAKADGPLAERARFERNPELEDLKEPLLDIVVEGNRAIKTDQILKLIKTRKGRPLDSKLVKDDVHTLVSKRWFFDVEPRIVHSKQGPVLVFRVREKPLLEKITYKGNKKIKLKELKELVEQCNLKEGGGYDVFQNREAVHRIVANYHEKGFRYATVELEKGDSPEDREVIFKIDEGPKVVVSKVSFSGNKYFSSPVLKTQVKTKTQILWLFGGRYDPLSIPEDVQALKKYYQELGFFDAQIKHNEILSDDKSHVHIQYVIEEGVRYKVRNINFVGNRVIPADKLRENMKVKPGQLYAERFVLADQEKMVAQYGELGRIFAVVEPKKSFHDDGGILDLVYTINEDRPYRIGRINVRINGDHPHTKENAVLTKLTYRPGELASKAKIEQSKRRLVNAQIFAGSRPGAPAGPQASPPEIHFKESDVASQGRSINLARGQSDAPETPVRSRKSRRSEEASDSGVKSFPVIEESPAVGIFRGQNPGSPFDDLPVIGAPDSPPGDFPERPGWLDTDVIVSETQTGRINLGVSVNSNAGLLGSAVLEENNFDLFKPPRSYQDILDGTAFRGGGQQFRIEAMPGIQLSRYLVSWRDPYFLDQNISFGVSGSYFSRVFPNWWERRGGGRVTLGHQFTPLLSASATLRAENVNISNPSVPVPPDIAVALGDNFLSTVKFSVVHDTRDNAFLPGRGHYIQADYEQAFGNFVYPKFDVEAKQYFLVRERPDGGNRQVISAVGQFGWIDSNAPFFERYFAGGFSSFRGFRFYGVTPMVNGVAIGGRFQALGTVEYLLPITADNTFQIVTFTDFGSVDSSITLQHYRQTVGAGIRLSVPMMGPLPIAIDFAVPLLRERSDITQLVSFTMGLLK